MSEYGLTDSEYKLRAREVIGAITDSPRKPGFYTDQAGKPWILEFGDGSTFQSVTLKDKARVDMGSYALLVATKVKTIVRNDRADYFPFIILSAISIDAELVSSIDANKELTLVEGVTIPAQIDGITIPHDLNHPQNTFSNASMLDEWTARLPHIVRSATYSD